jgi:6-pyruvoyltetrahydropterin/6-carboxytetrahydropterin synthase
VIVEVQTEQLETEKQLRGMYVDFSTLKADLAEITDALDHALLVEEGTLRAKTLEALKEEDFRMVFVDFRPTAENFSRYFYQKMKEKGYDVKCATVYETPANSASYTE